MRKYITVVSNSMCDMHENDVVRLSRSARSSLAANRKDVIEVWSTPDNASVILPVKQAYKKDINEAKRRGIKLKDAIFVSENVARMFNSQHRGVAWADTKPRKCAIGSDPEILLFNGGEVIYAGDFIPFNGEIGSDGPPIELRPKPGSNASEHVANIGKLMSNIETVVVDNAKEDFNALEYKCIPFFEDADRDYTTGGHIHLGISSYLKPDAVIPYNNNEIVFEVINHILNFGLALPMQLLDGQAGVLRRGIYGAADDIRITPDRLEYRVLSSTWLLYPDLADITLKVAHEITIEVSNRLLHYFKGGNCNTTSFETVSEHILDMELPSNIADMLMDTHLNKNDIEHTSLPVLEKLIDNNLTEALLEVTTNCHPERINRHVIQNWSRNASIRETF